MRTFALLGLFVVETLSQAAPICPPTRSHISGQSDVTKFFFKTATIGPSDRRTLKDFAKESGESEAEIAQRYSASGDIICGDHFAQAQVVIKNDLIVVPGHLLYDNDDCEKARDLKNCRLHLVEKGKRVTYEIAKEEAEGFTCPDNSTMEVRNDWAILRLKKPVSSWVKPYSIKLAPCATEDKPTDVVFVAKSDDYRRVASKPMIEAPRHYGRCQIMKGYCQQFKSPVMQSDCDMAPGASGGGLFVGDKDPQLVGINASHYKACPGSANDQTGPYRQKCWSSASVPIAGELKERLERLAQ